MNYKVNEIFNSFQGEGLLSGCAATFLRLSGCNLKCSWCDTAHEQGKEYDAESLLGEIKKVGTQDILVITGGEPTLQNLTPFLMLYKQEIGGLVTIETNGTRPSVLLHLRLRGLVDFITVSPKDNMFTEDILDSLMTASEVKVVMSEGSNPNIYAPYVGHLFKKRAAWIQPCSCNFEPAVKFVLEHPEWRLGCQLHKIAGAQ